jgi:hypothetical protein
MWRNHVQTDILEVNWGTCGDSNREVFSYLFQSNVYDKTISKELAIKATGSESSPTDCTVFVRNDVRGYYAGQEYKNHQLASNKQTRQVWRDKLESDATFFRELLQRFTTLHQSDYSKFIQQHNWHDYTVIGVHIRAGNGEQDHFVQAGRNQGLELYQAPALALSISKIASEMLSSHTSIKPVMVFVATDTMGWIDALRKSLDEHKGVSYQEWTKGEACWEGWKTSMMDMALMASARVVLATTRSTFTQILPLSIVLGKNRMQDGDVAAKSRYYYCEMDMTIHSGTLVTSCFDSLDSWLWRKESPWTIKVDSLSPQLASNAGDKQPAAFDSIHDSTDAAYHKLMVQLPDPEGADPLEADANSFLRECRMGTELNSTEFLYGGWHSRKFRRRKPASSLMLSRWNNVDENAG